MTPADFTAYIVALAAVVAAFVPMWLRKREDRVKAAQLELDKQKLATEGKEKQDTTSLISWEKMNTALDKRNADLERRVIETQQEYRLEIKQIEEDRDRQIATLRARVTELEERVVDLNMQLHRASHGGSIGD